MTPQRQLELFDEKFPHKIAEVVNDFGSTCKSDLKQHLIQTVISVLEKEISKIDRYLYTMVWVGYEAGYEHIREDLTKTLSEWKALQTTP